ncbi:putative sterigmatocystin biosynthesis fatty acid synthase subunit beta [Rosellinia necatrix]|uniref:Putative sterigmatocystin biosynthesis fatty acid synthase subunit beta n=1 Tax=Rosellinia necatrix TaxID=77044 RepID=A0A1W2TWC9_ROSNE|nr:putative sterigmatocystin biosynthesis fatty acid synthase subunit beta [Rosellinia necatrix]
MTLAISSRNSVCSTPFELMSFTPTTPETSASPVTELLVPFTIKSGEATYSFILESQHAQYLNIYRDQFLNIGSESIAEGSGSVAESTASLILRFIQFLSDQNVPVRWLAYLFRSARAELDHDDIHTFISQQRGGAEARKSMLRTLVSLLDYSPKPASRLPGALVSAVMKKEASILLVFGGQGAINPSCVDELAELYTVYRPLIEPLISIIDPILKSLSRHPGTSYFYQDREIKLREWLEDLESRPETAFISAAATSFPIIGLIDLAHYCIMCRILDKTPGEVGQLLFGVTGHSQGIIIAAVVALSDSWESFFHHARWAIELLFWLGYHSHRDAPQPALDMAAMGDSIREGEGQPSHLLVVRGLQEEKLKDLLISCNQHLKSNEHLYLALKNGPQNYVIAGSPRSLRGLTLRLRKMRAQQGSDQTRIPYSQRRPEVQCQFLPVSAPFHSEHLVPAADRVKEILVETSASPKSTDLRTPLFHTETGLEMRGVINTESSLTHTLIDAIASKGVNWPASLQLGQDNCPTHCLVFGGGRLSDLVHRVVDGRGIRVIDGTSLEPSSTTIGTKADIFTPILEPWQLTTPSWKDAYRPKMKKTAGGRVNLETRLSSLLKTPPVITAGMTPTTVHWDFVSAIICAGYHVEFAGGGYFDAATMEMAIEKLAASIPPGRGITINLIYASPKTLSFQIPLMRRLINQGIPVEGLTIGAGIPSPDIAAEYIESLGIKHISFKPGSSRAIREVIAIAKAHPLFPVILQWTGGRGGGHHSCEDFHEPLLETYGEIRRCQNLYLVVGSGFGDAAGALPYFTGEWALQFGRPAMPCDGILLGSRMMVAREAHTSPQAKSLLIQAPGVEDKDWERSYNQGGEKCGVLTVVSEMGQPIHKVATRAVRLWKELDDTVFSLPRAERIPALLRRKQEIISRLNSDFAKPWFGQDSTRKPADLEDMSYVEVISRLVELMYIDHEKRWIDASYKDVINDFAERAWERLGDESCQSSWDPSVLDEPRSVGSLLCSAFPDTASQLLHPEDVRFFINACRKGGRKPPNFILAFDEDFEYWFKKDSLWQSEDVNAVFGGDPERVCILQSPVSVRYITRDDQSAKEILDEIHEGLTKMLEGNEEQVIVVPAGVPNNSSSPDASLDEEIGAPIVFRASESSNALAWGKYVERYALPAVMAVFFNASVSTVSPDNSARSQPNPFYDLVPPRDGWSVHLSQDGREALLVDEKDDTTLARFFSREGRHIQISLYHHDAVPSIPAVLNLEWEFQEATTRLVEVSKARGQSVRGFYAQLWLKRHDGLVPGCLTDIFHSEEVVLSHHLHNSLNVAIAHSFRDTAAVYRTPNIATEAAVIAAWDVLIHPLLLPELQIDLLRLVHRSIDIAYTPGASPLQVGDTIRATSSVRSILIEPSGKSVTVEAHLIRHGQRVVTIASEFFIKGKFTDYHATFQQHDDPSIQLHIETDEDEAVLLDRNWLFFNDTSQSLKGSNLVFCTATRMIPEGPLRYASIKTEGKIYNQLWNKTRVPIGTVSFEATHCQGNPVTTFLQRKGTVIDATIPLKNPGWTGDSERIVMMPRQSQLYSTISKDCNPIHTSPVFAAVAGLPGTITHGMYISAVCRKIVEELVVAGDIARLRRFTSSFVGMVRQGEQISVGVTHVAMRGGRMVIEVSARLVQSGEEVLRGEAEVEQPSTTYLFTGQGTSSKGMGMALYDSSPVARALWDEMDAALMNQFGWSILDLVRENPKELTIYFRGREGRKVLDNYLAMKTEVVSPDGSTRLVPVLPGLTPSSTSYTFSDSRGLLHATAFAQPAIVLLEKATMQHMQASGLVQDGASFAGHSLGEYGALYSLAEFVEPKLMLSIIFYRGLVMQFAVQRDEDGNSGYSMVAANPTRVGKYFNEEALRRVVDLISEQSGELLEIVNFNLQDEQYVCAGHVRNIRTLTEILDFLSGKGKAGADMVKELLVAEDGLASAIGHAISACVAQSLAFPLDMELKRGKATIPLVGIDIPFHSKLMRSGIAAYRRFLQQCIKVEDIHPESMIGRFTPNVTGKPFSVETWYIEETAQRTESAVLKELTA